MFLFLAECSTQSNNASTNNFTNMSAGDIEALISEKDRLVQENDLLVQEKGMSGMVMSFSRSVSPSLWVKLIYLDIYNE